MESALYGIYTLVVFVLEILLVRCAHSFDFCYVNNSCVNQYRTPALSMKYSLFIYCTYLVLISVSSVSRSSIKVSEQYERWSRHHLRTSHVV